MPAKRDPRPQSLLDPHAIAILESAARSQRLLADLDPKVARDELCEQAEELVERISALLLGYDVIQVAEASRRLFLQWSHTGIPQAAGASLGPVKTELLTLIAAAAPSAAGAPRELPRAVLAAGEAAEQLLDIGFLLNGLDAAARQDPLGELVAMAQSGAVTTRSTSYPEAVSETVQSLFAPEEIRAALAREVGFDADQALSVLLTCHAQQEREFNITQRKAMAAASSAHQQYLSGHWDDALKLAAQTRIRDAQDVTVERATIAVSVVASAAGVPLHVVQAVQRAFSHTAGESSPLATALRFLGGSNPLRSAPVLSEGERLMIVHPADLALSVRSVLERALAPTAEWKFYLQHRGRLLEDRVANAFGAMWPDAEAWHGLRYYVPENEHQAAGPPTGYRGAAEADHFFSLGDVAVAVEDKASSLSEPARSGNFMRLRRDLQRIIQEASDQAARLITRVEQDAGLRLHDESWLDLSSVRETHLVTVSLDDLLYASTATAELMKAGFIKRESIAWTLSLHDLELIAALVERPAELLAYLRRRREPDATVYFSAPDELDLFLYFFESGLFVEPDPDLVRERFSWLGPVKPSERRRWRRQEPRVIASRTDALDAWWATTHGGSPVSGRPKPRRASSPLDPFLSEIERLQPDFGASIVAALLLFDGPVQLKISRFFRDIAKSSSRGTVRRSLALPVASLNDGGWLLIWMTRGANESLDNAEASLALYMRAKCNQLGLRRAAGFLVDGQSGELLRVAYDSHLGPLTSPDELRALNQLQPIDAMVSTASASRTLAEQVPGSRERRERRRRTKNARKGKGRRRKR